MARLSLGTNDLGITFDPQTPRLPFCQRQCYRISVGKTATRDWPLKTFQRNLWILAREARTGAVWSSMTLVLINKV